MKSSVILSVLCLLAVYQTAKTQTEPPLLGRPDGHEPGGQGSEQSLLGRPDGHEPDSSEESLEVDDEGDLIGQAAEDSDADSEDQEHTENGQEPLVRCKRPLCLMFCENGFETDSSGCPVCQCKHSNDSLIGRPDGHEPEENNCGNLPMCEMYCADGFKTGDDGCPVCECKQGNDDSLLGRHDGHEQSISCDDQPLCRMFCELGFQTDERGCAVCACLEDPCEGVECESGSVCHSQPCEDSKSCTKLSAKCTTAPKSLPCPEPMCANACQFGYKKNEAGCMTCQCDSIPPERVCGAVNCEEGQICRNRTDDAPSKCSIKTICEMQRELPVALGGTALQCEADGSFKPLQCNSKQAECWCVDGLGSEISGTRTTVYVDEHKPRCVRNHTVSMHIHMTLVVKHDIDVHKIDYLNAAIVDHVSSWMLIEPHYIKVAKAEAVESDEHGYDADDEETEESDELDSPLLLVVELVVLHDGQSDLPSAESYMRRRMRQGLCDISVGSGTLLPNPETLKTEHQFAEQPVPINVIGEPDPKAWQCWRGIRVALCAVGAVLFVLIIVTVILSVHRRRRMRARQFSHQKLVNQVSCEKDFQNNEPDNFQHADRLSTVKEEKEPIA